MSTESPLRRLVSFEAEASLPAAGLPPFELESEPEDEDLLRLFGGGDLDLDDPELDFETERIGFNLRHKAKLSMGADIASSGR